MTKIYDIKSKIEDLDIIIDKTIIIQVLNTLNSSFIQFFGILSHETRDKKKLLTLKSFANY